MSYKEEFIKFMIDSGVLTFGDFTTKSGRKTPYFINTGNYKIGSQLKKLGKFYVDAIASNTVYDEFDVLFGPAYKGIPLVSTVSIALAECGDDVEYCFNRKEAKDHGEGGTLIGAKLKDGDRILIVEDVITAGTSVKEIIPILQAAAKVDIKGLVVSVDRMEKGTMDISALQEVQEEFGIKVFAIVTVVDIVDYLIANSYPVEDIERIKEYMKLYCLS
jgi:orotate phosphoribosyltransferase